MVFVGDASDWGNIWGCWHEHSEQTIELAGEAGTDTAQGDLQMVTFEHKQLVRGIAEADMCPEDDSTYQNWRTGLRHIETLRENARANELIVAALGSATFVHTAVVDANHPGLRDYKGLRDWNCSLGCQTATQCSWTMTGDDVRFERVEHDWGTSALAGGWPLVYGRTFEGLRSPEAEYFEVAQPYTHHAEAHWRRERSAFCRFDRSGDWEDIVSISHPEGGDGVTLISFARDALDRYLVEHRAVLVRIFDFTFRRQGGHIRWHPSECVVHEMDQEVTFTQQLAIDGSISAARGAQIVRPMLSKADVVSRIRNRWSGDDEEDEPIQYKVLDIRHGGVATVSTDKSTTTNYFEAHENELPFDTSPAFFRPDVLAKYKGDTEKYTTFENRIVCRGGWSLKSYSVNEAGQIVVYICDLRALPREEQQHWAIYNEPPKAGLSDRAITTDFRGEWPEEMTPRETLVDHLQQWQSCDVKWWKWTPEASPDARIVVPRTGSRNEWEAAVGQLSNDVLEGFGVGELRRILENEGNEVDQNWRSIVLLERILAARGGLADGRGLAALRELNAVRNSGPAHAGETQARELSMRVLEEHGSYAAHFDYLCEQIAEELTLIDEGLAEQVRD